MAQRERPWLARLVIVANPENNSLEIYITKTNKTLEFETPARLTNNNKLSDRNEGEGRLGNQARPPAYAAPPNIETKTDPFTVRFTSDDTCIGPLIRVICRTNLSETNRFHSGLASGQLEITRTNFSL